MSYILDALKKLEKERKRGTIPGLSEQDSIVYHSQKKSVWPYLLIALLFLVAGVLIAWFSLVSSKNSVSQDTSTTGKTINQDSTEEAKSLPPALTPLQPPVPRPVPAVISDGIKPGMKKDKVSNSEVKEKNDLNKTSAVPAENMQKKRQETREESEPAQTEPIRETPPRPLIRKKLYKFAELPPSVRESLQKFFTITAYMYSSTPSERMVRINDRMMREGQELEPGIRIEEIVSDGVILSYKKFRFFVSLK